MAWACGLDSVCWTHVGSCWKSLAEWKMPALMETGFEPVITTTIACLICSCVHKHMTCPCANCAFTLNAPGSWSLKKKKKSVFSNTGLIFPEMSRNFCIDFRRARLHPCTQCQPSGRHQIMLFPSSLLMLSLLL